MHTPLGLIATLLSGYPDLVNVLYNRYTTHEPKVLFVVGQIR